MTSGAPLEVQAWAEHTLELGIREAGLSPTEVIDYIAVEDAGYSVERWSRIRDVDEVTVRANLRRSRRVYSSEE